MKKKLLIILVLGIIICASGIALGYKSLICGLSLKEYDGNISEGNVVYINGSFELGNVKDEVFNVETESSVLYREVMMVQKISDENGERLVLSNYQLDESQLFESDVNSQYFYGDSKINGLSISDDLLEYIYKVIRKQGNTIEVLAQDENSGNKFNLTLANGSYVTASDDWAIGDIKVSFSTINNDSLAIVGTIKDGKLSLNEFSQVGSFTLSDARNDILSQGYLYDAMIVSGLVLIVLAVVLNKKGQKCVN